MNYSELYKIRFLILIELVLVAIFFIFDLIPLLIVLGTIIVGLISYFIFKSPVLGVHFLIFSILADSFLPFKNISSQQSIAIVEVCLVFLLGLATLKFLFRVENRESIPKSIFIWLPFLFWSLIIGLSVGIDNLRILTYWKNYFAGFFAFTLIFYVIKSPAQLKSIMLSIIIWGLILALLEIKVLIELGGLTKGLVSIFFKKNLLSLGWGKSNYLAAFSVIIIPFTIGYLLYVDLKRTKVIVLFSIFIMTFSMILTLSRGAIISLLISLMILLPRVVKAKSLISFLLVILVIVIVIFSNPLTFVLIDRISSLDVSSSYFSRVNYYVDTWNTFLKYPLTGVGFGNVSYYATFILAAEDSPSAHNIVLGMLAEVGIFGAIFYFSILALLLRTIYLSYKKEDLDKLKILKWCCLSSIIGGFAHALMEPTLEGLQFSIMFWTIAGVCTKLDYLKIRV
jgi:O-antigen ligase